jgi:predicted metal-dependent peptidase
MSEQQKQLDRAKIQLITHKSMIFITYVCYSLKHIWDERLPYFAATNGVYIKYNPTMWLTLDEDEQLFVLLHETWHVAFSHMARLHTRDMLRFNYAADYVINYMLVQAGFKMPEGMLYDEQYAGMSTEEVYDLLTPEECTDDSVSDLEPSGETSDEVREAKEKLDEILVRASIHTNSKEIGTGEIPSEITLYIDSLVNPTVPWTRLLSRFASKLIKSGRSFKRPNRRSPKNIILPVRFTSALTDIAIAGDISGSVSDKTFTQYLSEAYYVLAKLKPTSMTFIQFDHLLEQVDVVTDVKELMDVKLHGRGGTKIGPVIDWAAENKPSVIVILTDGRFHLNSPDPEVPVIWTISDNPHFTAPFGTVIHLKT